MDNNEKFWIYHHLTRKHVRIHFASCSHCNNGNGVHDDKTGAESEWIGPFLTREEVVKKADDIASREGSKDYQFCEFCCK